jgi:hypothetical protein
MELDKKSLVWKAITMAAGAGAGVVAERVLTVAWDKSVGHGPPKNPADRRTSWPEAILWGVATGIGFGIARVVANRSAAAVWELATDEAPPGLKTDAA